MTSLFDDEFSSVADGAREWSLATPTVEVRRGELSVDGLRSLSFVGWGATPQVVFLHGLGQNARTFDVVSLALTVPSLAIDLPGHGRSDGAPASMTTLDDVARDLIVAIEALVTPPIVLVGMSLGGLCALTLAARRPDLVSQLVLLDITPGVTREGAQHVFDFLAGPALFPSREAMVERAVAFNPQRSVASLERGVAANARQLPDGTWGWRYLLHPHPLRPSFNAPDLWDALGGLPRPVTLLYGDQPSSVVSAEDRHRFTILRPHDQLIAIEGAGHSLQGDRPLAVARAIRSLLGPDA